MKKKYLSLLLISVLMLSFVGVGYEPAMTVNTIFEKMDAAAKSAQSVNGNIIIDFQSTMSLSEKAIADSDLTEESQTEKDSSLMDAKDSLAGSYPFNMNFNYKVSSVLKSGITKTEGTVLLNYLGSETNYPILTYEKEDKKSLTTYTYDSDSKSWSKEKSALDSNFIDSMSDLDSEDVYSDLTVADDLVSYNNKECYQITGIIDSDKLPTSMTDSSISDVAPIKMKTTIYVDSTTFYPVKYEFNMSDYVFDQTSEEDEYNIKLSKFIITIDLEYNTVKSITIPKKALKAKGQKIY